MNRAVVLVLLALGLIVVRAHLATGSYSDPAGDSSAAPDITSVVVSHDSAGFVSMAVTTNQPLLSPDAMFWGYIDADRNASTGFPFHGLGADEMFLGDGTGASSLTSTAAPSSSLRVHAHHVVRRRRLHCEVQSERDRPTDRFAFAFESELDDANGDAIATDAAPDGPPGYEYSFAPLSLTMASAVGSPRTPCPASGSS